MKLGFEVWMEFGKHGGWSRYRLKKSQGNQDVARSASLGIS